MLKRVHGFPHVRFEAQPHRLNIAAAGLFMAVALGACNEEKRTTPSADAGPASSAISGPILGGKLGQAVAAAASAAPVQKEDKPGGGPPETGIFAAGAADAEQAPTAAPKLQLFGEGNDPKVSLAYAFGPGSERKVTLILQIRAAQSALTPLTMDLVFKSEKPKDDKKADKGKDKDKVQDKPVEDTGLPVTVKVADAKPIRGGTLPPELEGLKEVVLRYRLSPKGVPTDLAIEYPKKTNDTIDLMTGAMVDVALGMTIPLPDKPVGAGAYWMVTDRTHSTGVDVVRYRVAKVAKLDGKSATLALDIREYAANTNFNLPGMPKEIQVALEKFESQGKGEVTIGQDAFVPEKGQINVVMQSFLSSPQQQQPGQRLGIQTDIRAALSNTP